MTNAAVATKVFLTLLVDSIKSSLLGGCTNTVGGAAVAATAATAFALIKNVDKMYDV